MSTRAAIVESAADRRLWWLRTLLVLQSPRPVFAALRDDSEGAVAARQEPVLALILLAGIAGVLATGVAGRLLDDPELDPILVAVWAFIGGSFYGTAFYWLGGALLHGAARLLGSAGSYRRSRHVVAFAATPVALSLVVLWPFRLALFGGDLFRSGGADSGAAGAALAVVWLGFVVWAVALLGAGIRAVHGWSRPRSAATFAIAAAAAAALVVLASDLQRLGL